MITTAVIQRVYKLKNNGKAGTIFTVDIDDKQYIVTAKHLVDDIGQNNKLQIYQDNKWKEINLSLLGHCPNDVDISVLTTDRLLTPSSLHCEPSSKGIFLAQDVFFLGFPYDIVPVGGTFSNGYPLPFIKKAILSAIFLKNNREVIYLDGHNNPGFSGGPVVYKSPNTKSFKICGVVSGYRCQQQPTYISGSPTNLYYRENTGIILSYGIKHAIDLINSNPIGFKL